MPAFGCFGTLLKTMLALVFISRTDSLPNRCLITSPSGWQVVLANALPSFFITAAAPSSHAPVVSPGIGKNPIPSYLHAFPYLFNFCFHRVCRVYPGSWAALWRVACWKGETTLNQIASYSETKISTSGLGQYPWF